MLPDVASWDELLGDEEPLEFEPVPFAHPLYVLFSSGTTALPKAIVHGHGGILLEHLKNHGLSWDLRPGDRLQWFTTTAWMMWNALVSTLLLRASVVMIDGNPAHPDLSYQWRLAETTRPTMLGVSPAFVMACRKEGLEPGAALRPLLDPHDRRRWLALAAGGVRVALPAARAQRCRSTSAAAAPTSAPGSSRGIRCCRSTRARCRGAAWASTRKAFGPDGEPVVGELGELVIAKPMPSMPVALWNDPDGSRARAAYFDTFPGVWRHGDWIVFSERGSSMVTGRSDATLNRGGVRLGTSEFYVVVEELEEVLDSLVVHLDDPDELFLFVALREGVELDDELRARIAGLLRTALSPRHVPDEIVAVPAIPRTLTGKKLELPVKRILAGVESAEVVSADALVDPASIDAFVAYSRARRG